MNGLLQRRSSGWSGLLHSLTAVLAAAALAGSGKSSAQTPVPSGGKETPILRAAEREYDEAILKAQSGYRKALAAAFDKADDVELFLLDFNQQAAPNLVDASWFNRLPLDSFPIISYKAVSKILKKRTLSTGERKLFLPGFQRVLITADPRRGAMCHYPIHGIRIWSRNIVVFQTSICWECHNFYVQYPGNDGAYMIGFSDPDFEKLMGSLMPIPKDQIDRFNASMRDGVGGKR